MLETIITEATFFCIWVFFHEHSRFTGQQQRKWEAISLLLIGSNVIRQIIIFYEEVKWED